MKEKTTYFIYYNPADVLDDEIAALFFNEDGSETIMNVYLPRTPIVVEGYDNDDEVVYAVFTTVEDFLKDPPEYLKAFLENLRETKGKLGAEEVIDALNWYDDELQGTSTDVLYSLFSDGTLVYALRNL